MDLKWNVGGCGTDCGSSGVTVECPCQTLCDEGTARKEYDVQWSIPGGGPYPPGFSGSERLTYVSEQAGGCCVYEGSDTHSVCGVDCYAQLVLCGSTATILLRKVSDDSVYASFDLATVLGSTDCSGTYSLSPGGATAFCGNVPLATASAEGVGTEEPPCTETPYVIPPGSGNCCPCDECGLFYDPINRLDSDDPGDLWTEVSGDWYVEEAGLRSDDADAIILANMTAPAGVEMRTTIVPRLGNAGDYNLILGYTDADNYFRVCWTYGGTESAASDTLKLYQMEAGVETELTLTSELAQEEYDGGPGWLLIGCINATRTHLTGYVRSTNDVPVLLSSAQISAADVGDQAGLGEVTAASGSYRSPTINVVSTDCQTCPSYVTCASTAGIAPCANNRAPREWLITLPGGWVQPAPIGGFTGNACCPQWSSASVVAEFMPEVSAAGFFPGADPLSKLYCVWLYEVQMHIPPDTADEMGCTSFPVYRFFVLLVPESAGGTQFRWHAYAKMRNANNIYTDLAEWLSDPYEIGEFDCQSPFSIPVKAITDEHPGDMANWAGQSYCDGAMGSPLLVEPV